MYYSKFQSSHITHSGLPKFLNGQDPLQPSFNRPMGVLFRYEDSEDDIVRPTVRRAGGWRYDETSEPSGSESGSISSSEEQMNL